jgi:hypothetical protein
MTKLVAPVVSKVDLIMALSTLWENSDYSMFIDSSEGDSSACSITFFMGESRSTVGLVFTKKGGAARICDANMEPVAQSLEKFSLEDYYGIRNMMLKIQKALPLPKAINIEDIMKEIEDK